MKLQDGGAMQELCAEYCQTILASVPKYCRMIFQSQLLDLSPQ
jgi:hypothetical protein